jgi:hypothetical protein
MCVVSNIGDYYRRTRPEWPKADPWDRAWPVPSIPKQTPEELAEAMRKFRDLVKAGEEADKAAGDKDCEKGEVKDYIKQVLERLEAIEQRLTYLEQVKK